MSLYKGTDLISGHQVLYSTKGSNTDGAMTQDACTNNFADVSLSNLSSTATKNIDGQWTSYVSTVASSVSLTGTTELSYTIGVPNDGYQYEILLSCELDSGSTSGDYARINVRSDKFTNYVTLCRYELRWYGYTSSHFIKKNICPEDIYLERFI